MKELVQSLPASPLELLFLLLVAVGIGTFFWVCWRNIHSDGNDS